MADLSPPDIADVVARLAREEMPRLVGIALGITRDVGMAEECAQDALLRALQAWPETGVPDNPAAWLVVTARHRALDLLRHRRLAEARLAEEAALRPAHVARAEPESEPALRDDLLRLVVACCHPTLSREQGAALALRLVCGLTTGEIARLFLVSETTVAQRLVRARRCLEDAAAGWEDPTPELLSARLESVLDVAYLVLTEAHAATEGPGLVRPDLLARAVVLSGHVAELLPEEPEALGIAALACFQAGRSPARVAAGRLVLLQDQDRSVWDAALMGRGLELLRRASLLGEPGPRQVEAALAACHAVAESWEDTDWRRIVRLYDRLLSLAPSPMVELNRAAALSFSEGPQAAWDWLASRDMTPLRGHSLLHATRGDLLRRLGRLAEAAAEYESALAACTNPLEHDFLDRRLAECRSDAPGG